MKSTLLKSLAIVPLMGLAISASANSSYSTTESATDTSTTGTMNTGTVSNPGTTGTITNSNRDRAAGSVGTSNTTTVTGSSPSAMDQSSGTTQDVEVTRSIREELSKSGSLSTSAKNVEVITLNNTVTLRGAVASQAERTQLVNTAQRAAGNRAIRNEITVDSTRR